MGYYEFPNTRNYDSDLGFLIKKYKELGDDYNTLVQIYEEIKKQYDEILDNIEIITIQQLQKWLDDGTLENLISSLGGIVRVFDTTENMIISPILVNGLVVKTLGYSTVNDGGGALFLIENSISDEYFQFNCGKGLYATLIINDKMINIKQVGMVNSLTNFQTFLDFCTSNNYDIFIPKGNYLITDNGTNTYFYRFNTTLVNIIGEGLESRILIPRGVQKSLFYISGINAETIIFKNFSVGINDNDRYLGDYASGNHIFYFDLETSDFIRNVTFTNLFISKVTGYFIYQLASSNINNGITNCVIQNSSFYSQCIYADKVNMMIIENNIVYRTTTGLDGRYAFNMSNNQGSYTLTFRNNQVDLPSIFNNIHGINFDNEYYESGANIENPTTEALIKFTNCYIYMENSNFTSQDFTHCILIEGSDVFATIINSQFNLLAISSNYALESDNNYTIPFKIINSTFLSQTSQGVYNNYSTNVIMYNKTYKADFNGATILLTLLDYKNVLLEIYNDNNSAFKTFTIPVYGLLTPIIINSTNKLNYISGFTFQLENTITDTQFNISTILPCTIISKQFKTYNFELVI